jgi:folate-binding protein YgfZ
MTLPALPAASDRELLDALDRGVAWIDRSDRVRMEVTGPDRAKFLHNLTTNEVKRLGVGRGCEAFVTSPQGKTLGFVTLHAGEDRIWLRTDSGGLVHVLPHFGKYGALDDVAWDDATARTFEQFLVGPRAGDLIRALGGEVPPEGDLTHHATCLAGHPVLIVREAPTVDPGLTIVGDAGDADAVSEAIAGAGRALGLVRMTPEQFEALRIEAGTPAFGRDVTDANLPQEAARDARAISFVKGCYLGQETVARLDALGHVNKILRALRFEGAEVPPAGSSLSAEGKAVGVVTSAARSIRDGAAVGLAIVRVTHAEPGAELACAWEGGEALARVIVRSSR